VEKTYNFRIKSETGKSAMVLLTLKENTVHSLTITLFVFNHHKSFNKIQEQCWFIVREFLYQSRIS